MLFGPIYHILLALAIAAAATDDLDLDLLHLAFDLRNISNDRTVVQKVSTDGSAYYGIVARREISPGDHLFTVANEHYISSDNLNLETEDGDEIEPYLPLGVEPLYANAMFVLAERALGERSLWTDILAALPLPPRAPPDTPVTWARTWFDARHSEQHEITKRDLERLIDVHSDERHWALLAYSPAAKAAVINRLLECEDSYNRYIATTGSPLLRGTSRSLWCDVLVVLWSRSFSLPGQRAGIVPKADFFNADWRLRSQVAARADERGDLHYVATKRIAKGEQVFAYYGRQGELSTIKSLIDYGYVLRPHDRTNAQDHLVLLCGGGEERVAREFSRTQTSGLLECKSALLVHTQALTTTLNERQGEDGDVRIEMLRTMLAHELKLCKFLLALLGEKVDL